MGATALIVRDNSGSILYDTSKAIYGLIKSGPVEFIGSWNKLSPNGGYSVYTDFIYKFEVEGALSPILFTNGACAKPVQSREGNKSVFYFAGPVANLKVYCFDIMRPILSGPALKTRAESGRFTFNSLQWPLNVIGTTVPPPSTGVGADGRLNPFTGGRQFLISDEIFPNRQAASAGAEFRVSLDPSKNYAAYIPWSRSVEWVLWDPGTGWTNPAVRSSAEEGCCGGLGYVAHYMWTTPENTYDRVDVRTRPGFFNILNDRRPRSAYIDVAEYPYPFNPQL